MGHRLCQSGTSRRSSCSSDRWQGSGWGAASGSNWISAPSSAGITKPPATWSDPATGLGIGSASPQPQIAEALVQHLAHEHIVAFACRGIEVEVPGKGNAGGLDATNGG